MRRFSIHDVGSMIKFIDEEARKAAKAGLLAAAHRTVAHITTHVLPSEPRPPIDRGAYRAGWRAEKTEHGAMVINTLPYAAIIEFGARPENVKIGRKMIEALTEWVRRKGFGGRGKGKASAAEDTAVAWAIAVSMKKRGIFNGGKGLRVMEKAAASIPGFIRDEVQRELAKIGR